MVQSASLLDSVSVASPCTADWEAMVGNDQVRFCGQCQLNVYNLSDMTPQEAESLITQTEGKRCIRFYRREDGTMLTKDCPKGFRAISRKAWGKALKVASVVLAGLLGGMVSFEAPAHAESPTVMPPGPPSNMWGPPNNHTMGEMIIPERPPYVEPPTVVPVTPIKEPHPIQVVPERPALPQNKQKSEAIQPFVRFSTLLACDANEGSNDDPSDVHVTTMMVGEEGGHGQEPPPNGQITTMAVGEEGGSGPITPPEGKMTTMAVGEEGGVSPQPPQE